MDSPPTCSTCEVPASATQKDKVDLFLLEALENPRHRLTFLRMELDIQRFMRNPDQLQFEFQHFPTSYLRCAAHRVAQHYGLQTMVLDNMVDGSGRIMVQKTLESRFPAILLSDIPAKQPENGRAEQVKIVIRPRPNKALQNGMVEVGIKCNPVRTVEERKEDYDRARARIFKSSSSGDLETSDSQAISDGRSVSRDEMEWCRNVIIEPERNELEPEKNGVNDGASRVAIFRDREKDRIDPDYDRSYDRYSRGIFPNQSFSLGPYNVPQPPFVQYEACFPQLGQMPPRTQTSPGYTPSNQIMNPYCSVGYNQTSRDTLYMQWANPAALYAHSYEQFRLASFQAPFYQQPLSFGKSQDR